MLLTIALSAALCVLTMYHALASTVFVCVRRCVCSFSSQPKSKPCLVKRTSSCDMSDSECVSRDGTVSEGAAVGVDSTTLTAMQLTTLTLAVTPGTVHRRASPCSGTAACLVALARLFSKIIFYQHVLWDILVTAIWH